MVEKDIRLTKYAIGNWSKGNRPDFLACVQVMSCHGGVELLSVILRVWHPNLCVCVAATYVCLEVCSVALRVF